MNLDGGTLERVDIARWFDALTLSTGRKHCLQIVPHSIDEFMSIGEVAFVAGQLRQTGHSPVRAGTENGRDVTWDHFTEAQIVFDLLEAWRLWLGLSIACRHRLVH